jgi:uncharacterized protein (TIGR02453 family)
MYFTPDFHKFFIELAENNHKDWFDLHRERYQKSVKEPFYRFLADFIEAQKKLEPYIVAEPKHVAFRINRDIRFSKNKSPYKTHVAAAICKYGKKETAFPGIYLHFDAEKVLIASGVWAPTKEELYAIRWAISENPKPFYELINQAEFKSVFGEIKGEKNKRIESEFSEESKVIPELFFKQFFYEKELPKKVLYSENLIEEIITIYATALSLNRYFGAIIEQCRNR